MGHYLSEMLPDPVYCKKCKKWKPFPQDQISSWCGWLKQVPKPEQCTCPSPSK